MFFLGLIRITTTMTIGSVAYFVSRPIEQMEEHRIKEAYQRAENVQERDANEVPQSRCVCPDNNYEVVI